MYISDTTRSDRLNETNSVTIFLTLKYQKEEEDNFFQTEGMVQSATHITQNIVLQLFLWQARSPDPTSFNCYLW
jgi:hypothetical protein